MGITAKIIPYKKNKSNAFDKIEVLNFIVSWDAAMLDRRYNTFYPYGIGELYAKESQYGLIGRIMRGKLPQSGGGGYANTYAYITGFAQDEFNRAYITHTGNWSNGLPEIGTAIHIDAYQKPDNRFEDIGIQLDCQSSLLEDNVIVNFKSESNVPLDVEYSFGEITLHANSEVESFFNTYWRNVTFDIDYEYIFGLQLYKDGVAEAWLCFQRADIFYDPIELNYKIKCYDWVKIQLSQVGGEKTPLIFTFAGQLPLSQYLLAVFENFGHITTDIDTGDISQTLNGNDYKAFQHFTWGTEIMWISVGDLMSVDDFLDNIQRHYAGFIYYTPDKQIAFRSRNVVNNTVNIDDVILEETFTEEIKLKDYNHLLINFKNWVLDNVTQSGWALISENRTKLYYLNIEYGLSEDDVNARNNYIDLRHSLPEPFFEYVIFPIRTPQQVYEDYRDLLRDTKIYKCSVNSLDIDLFTEVIYNTFAYRVINVRKDYISETSEIEISKTI